MMIQSQYLKLDTKIIFRIISNIFVFIMQNTQIKIITKILGYYSGGA